MAGHCAVLTHVQYVEGYVRDIYIPTEYALSMLKAHPGQRQMP